MPLAARQRRSDVTLCRPILEPVILTDVQSGFLSLGQASARTIARRSAASGRLQRTLLVHGPAGADKSAFVDDLLALLLCTDAALDARPCNACRGCRDARAHSHPDLLIGSPQAWRGDRSTGESIVAAARRWLLRSAGAPVVGELRIVVLEGIERAGEQIQNALLKVLEEPGARHMFILVADEPSRLLPTIRSRCQALRIGPVPRAELVAWLMDRERLPHEQADALAQIAGGLSGTATEFARRPELVDWRRRTQQELLDLLQRGPADRFGSIRDLLDAAARLAGPTETDDDALATPTSVQRDAAVVVVDAWLGLARDLLVASAGRPGSAPTAELLTGLAEVASRVPTPELIAFVATLERVREGLLQNAAPKLAMEVAMLAWPSVDRMAAT